jgi:RNA polymerase sigma factor (sigma-70 family)
VLKVIVSAEAWAAAARDAAFRPPALEALGWVPCATEQEVAGAIGPPLRVVLDIDPARLSCPVDGGRILGPIDRGAVLAVTPLRPRTPEDHTLHGVLTQVHLGERDAPEVVARMDAAFARETERVRGWARAELRGYAEAEVEEVVQEVLADAWAQLGQYVPNARFAAWLRRITLNKCASHRRRRRDAMTEDGELDPESGLPDVLARLEEQERIARLERAAAEVLDDLEQEIVVLRYVHDYPLAEIPQRLGAGRAGAPKDADQVRVALQRIRRRLAAALRGQEA